MITVAEIEFLREALRDAEYTLLTPCLWVLQPGKPYAYGDITDSWFTACGMTYTDGARPTTQNCQCCPRCGKRIEIVTNAKPT